MLALMAVVAFYALGTGFDFFFRFLYALLLLTGIGFSWAWLNLRGIELSVTRDANRGRVGGYLKGRVTIINRTNLPKSWLEVVEATGPSANTSGRGLAFYSFTGFLAWKQSLLCILRRLGVCTVGTGMIWLGMGFGICNRRLVVPHHRWCPLR